MDDVFTIIDNQGPNAVSGTFTQGSSITVGGSTFNILYNGGDGNDVVLSMGPVAGPVCDFDGNGMCDIADLNRLYDDIQAGLAGGPTDLDGSGLVDNDDIDEWLAAAGTENGKVYLPGDVNLDGDVGGSDFTALALGFGQSGLPGAYWGDGNFDGNAGGSFAVGGADFTALAVNFGHTSVSAVPEPGSFAMLLLLTGLVGGLSRKKR